MPGKKRKAQDVRELLTSQNLANQLDMLPSLRDRALIAFLYLTGARVSEVVRSKRHDSIGFRMSQLSIKKIILEEGAPEKTVILFQQIPCLKRRKNYAVRTIPLSNELNERRIIKHLSEYCIDLAKRKKDQVDPVLFNITRQGAWRIINRATGSFCHHLRHWRATVLSSEHNYTAHDLKQFFGWTSTKPSDNYVHLNWQNLMTKMIR